MKLSDSFILLACLLVMPCLNPANASAANQCQVQLTKTSGQISTETLNNLQSKSYNMTIKDAYAMATGNNVIIEIQNDIFLSYSLKSNQKLIVPEGTRLKKIQCLKDKSTGSGSITPSASDIAKLFKNNPVAAAEGLKDLHNLRADQVVVLLRNASVGIEAVCSAVVNVFTFGAGGETVKRVYKGLKQTGARVAEIVDATKHLLNNSTKKKNSIKWLKQAGFQNSQSADVAQAAKDHLNATRDQVQDWMEYAGYASSSVAAAVDEVFGQAAAGSPTGSSNMFLTTSRVFDFVLVSPYDSPVTVKVHAPAVGFPDVCMVPTGNGLSVPIPFPNISGNVVPTIEVQFKQDNGRWTKKYKIQWSRGRIKLPDYKRGR